MTILIDADGCPVVDIAVKMAAERKIDCVILCDTAHVFEKAGAKTITVSKGNDSVDFALVNMVQAGDVVITQDYGLAAMCLARKAVPISQDGMVYTDANIDALLLARHTAKKIRMAGGKLKGNAKRSPAQDEDFRKALDMVTQMKSLIFINGTMGVGKTTTGRQLQKLLPKCVFLDGDWCWDASPFVVTEETKNMVLQNIGCLLNNFLLCSEYENIVFCWVMHDQSIIDDVLSKIDVENYRLYKFTLSCSESALVSRISKDVDNGIRTEDIIERSIPRLQNYSLMDTIKIDVSDITAEQAAKNIFKQLHVTL